MQRVLVLVLPIGDYGDGCGEAMVRQVMSLFRPLMLTSDRVRSIPLRVMKMDLYQAVLR